MGRAARNIPLVVLPEGEELDTVAALDLGARHALDVALGGLTRLLRDLLRTTRRTRQLQSDLATAIQALRRFTGLVAPAMLPIDPVTIASRHHVHTYFGVRCHPLSGEQHLAQTAAILLRDLVDLRDTLLDVNDLSAEAEAMIALLGRFSRQARDADATISTPFEPQPAVEPCAGGLERWIVAHHWYFLLNLHAAQAVRKATAALAVEAETPAVELLKEARTYVQGFTAAMVHAGSIPSSYYLDLIRPTMQPPATTVLLTGAMQPEHASYRSALEGLLCVSPEPFNVLARRCPGLALAREALLDADLLDIERHVAVAAALVGNERSLVQHHQAPDNAVSTLRRMRHARAARYGDLVRFGDRAMAVETQRPAPAWEN